MKQNNPNENNEYTGKLYAYISIGLDAVCVVFLGLMFSVLGIYALIGAILSALASLAFANAQKRKNAFKGLKIIIIVGNLFFAVSIGVFIGGICWQLVQN